MSTKKKIKHKIRKREKKGVQSNFNFVALKKIMCKKNRKNNVRRETKRGRVSACKENAFSLFSLTNTSVFHPNFY